MIKEQGVIVAVHEQHVVVEVLQTSACQSCKAKQGCGQAVMSEWGDATRQQKKNHFNISFSGKAKPGDIVELGMAEDTVSRVALLVYLLPLGFAFLGLFLTAQFGFSEAVQLPVMVIAFGLAVLMLSKLKLNKMSTLEPVILHLSSAGKGDGLIASTASETL